MITGRIFVFAIEPGRAAVAPDVPLTVVQAAVRRPEWLVEIERLAVRPV